MTEQENAKHILDVTKNFWNQQWSGQNPDKPVINHTKEYLKLRRKAVWKTVLLMGPIIILSIEFIAGCCFGLAGLIIGGIISIALICGFFGNPDDCFGHANMRKYYEELASRPYDSQREFDNWYDSQKQGS